MTRLTASICVLALCAAATLSAQSSRSSQAFIDSTAAEGGGAIHSMKTMPPQSRVTKPFSRIAFGGGVSALGVNLSMATNLNRYMNLRASGNLLNYSVNNISTNGFNIGAKLNMASAGTSVDFYPFPNHGFRISPGALFYNQNSLTGSSTVAAGQSFKLNDQTYYSSASSPVTGTGTLNLNTNKQAFTATTGWGNMIPRSGGHWSFPVEIGAAFIGTPSLKMNIAGIACDSTGAFCQNVATNSQIQANLQAQVAKYQKDLDPLKTYPLASFGLAYSFKTRSGR
jgi:hypothetical protein